MSIVFGEAADEVGEDFGGYGGGGCGLFGDVVVEVAGGGG